MRHNFRVSTDKGGEKPEASLASMNLTGNSNSSLRARSAIVKRSDFLSPMTLAAYTFHA
jgi:hypothetical protein